MIPAPANYDTPNTPNPRNYRRVTTDCFFTPDDADGKTGDIRLGSITMQDLKSGQADVEVMRAWKGGLQRADQAVSEVKPEFDLTLNEYHPNLIPVLLFGERGDDEEQVATAGLTLDLLHVYPGRSYRLGRRMLSNVAVVSGAQTLQPDLHYQLDPEKGMVTIMEGAGIADGAPITATFDCAALSLRTFKSFTRLNRYGFMRLYEEDTYDKNPRGETYFRCNLIATETGAGDPKKYAESKVKCVVLGQMSHRSR